MSGKNKCKILKEIRQKIADANDIPFVTSECRYQGDCKGTCPKCEAELVYLENELRKRQMMGKCIVLAGVVTASVFLAFKGCDMIKEKLEDSLQIVSTPGAVEAVFDVDMTEESSEIQQLY